MNVHDINLVFKEKEEIPMSMDEAIRIIQVT